MSKALKYALKFELYRHIPQGSECYRQEETYKDKEGGDRGYITTGLTKETFCYMKSKAVIINANVQSC